MMSDPALLALWSCVALGTLGLGLVAVRAAGSLPLRVGALAVVMALTTGAYAAGERVLGRARPVSFELMQATDEVRVLYAQAVPDEGIFLLVDTGAAPLYYRLPWSEEGEQQLRAALQAAQEAQTGVRARLDRNEDELEPMFYAEPPPALPAKSPDETATEYRDPAWRS